MGIAKNIQRMTRTTVGSYTGRSNFLLVQMGHKALQELINGNVSSHYAQKENLS